MKKEEAEERLDRLLSTLERLRLEEYLHYISDKPRLFRNYFLMGVARGLGSVVGFAILGAVFIGILQKLVEENVPLIGDFLARVIEIVRART